MHQILCSTGALIGRPNGRDYRLLKQFCPQLECDGFEFMLYTTWYDQIEALTSFLKSIQLHIPVMHCEKSISEHISKGGDEELREAFRLFEINCSVAEAAGAEKMVFHLWNGIISDSNFENNLRDYPEIQFVFDTKMADFHRQLELLYEPEYDWLWKENHILHYHVNDYGGGYKDWSNLKVLPMGKGHIDFEHFFRFVRQTAYRGDFTFEATGFDQTGTVNIRNLNEQFALARRYLDQV